MNIEEQKVSSESSKDINYGYLSEKDEENKKLSNEQFIDQSILRSQVVEAKNELDVLTCPICMNILFKPISCSGCTQSFCKACINQWITPKPASRVNQNGNNSMPLNNNIGNNNGENTNNIIQNIFNNNINIFREPNNFNNQNVQNNIFSSAQNQSNNRRSSHEDDEDDDPFLFNSQPFPSQQTQISQEQDINANIISFQQQNQDRIAGGSQLMYHVQQQLQQGIQNQNQIQLQQIQQQQQQQQILSNNPNVLNRQTCPHCKQIFKGTNIPLVNKLLGSMKIKCFYYENGCTEILPYDSYEKHCLKCPYEGVKCEGCKEVIIKKDVDEHISSCKEINEKCEKCQFEQPRRIFFEAHTEMKCLQLQIVEKDKKSINLIAKVDQLATEVQLLRLQLNTIQMGIPDNINNFSFQTVFTNNFKFLGNQAMLEKDSFNEQKKKKDFLHFFLNRPFYVHSPVLQMFKIRIDKLQGNIIMGISDSQLQNSMDFMVNKQGDIKKKEKNENKYKQKDRAANFIIQEKNTILIKYIPFLYTVEFFNIDLNVSCKLDSSYILEFPHQFFFFYSLDHQGDQITFLSC
ncbi:hypothetical protein ABPG72_008600 [Tetrahymena utriculariae]